MGKGCVRERERERERDALLEVIFTEVIIEAFKAAEIIAKSQGHNSREDPHLLSGGQMWDHYKMRK
jgi:hypothetical protein